MRGFKEGENGLMLLGRQSGPNAHVQHDCIPLRVAISRWRPDVMTVHAGLGPELGSRLFFAGWRLSLRRRS